MIRTIRELINWAIVTYLVYLLVSLLSFFVFEYGDFVNFFKNHYPSAYRIDEYGEKSFSPDHYQFVTYGATPLGLLLVVLILLLVWKRKAAGTWTNRLITDILWIKDLIVIAFKNRTRNERLLLFTCILSIAILKLYFFFALPFHVDEAFNFVYFADQGIFHSSVFANNHTLTNIISAIWWKTGLSPEISFRLTSVVSSVIVHVLIYSITVYYFNFRAGIFVLVLSGVTLWGNVYAVEGVGYMLMTLWVVIALTAVFSMCEVSDRGLSLFVASSVLGFYTSQLFMIPFIALVTFWIGATWYRGVLRDDLLRIVAAVALVALASVLLYFPMYLWSGFEAAFHSNIARHDLIRMSPELFEGFSVMTDLNSKSYLALMSLIIVSIFYFRAANVRVKSLIALQLSIILSILIFSLIIGVYPPSRTLVFANILLYCSVGAVVSDIAFKGLGNRQSVAVLGLILFAKLTASLYMFGAGWQHMPGGLQDKKFYEAVSNLSTRILANKPALIFSDERDTHLNFYLALEALRKDQRVEFTYDSTRMAEADVVIFSDENADVGGEYERVRGRDFGAVLIKRVF